MWGRNATKQEKLAAYQHYAGTCHRCGKSVSYNEAKFHHLRRGIIDQHAPSPPGVGPVSLQDMDRAIAEGASGRGSV